MRLVIVVGGGGGGGGVVDVVYTQSLHFVTTIQYYFLSTLDSTELPIALAQSTPSHSALCANDNRVTSYLKIMYA